MLNILTLLLSIIPNSADIADTYHAENSIGYYSSGCMTWQLCFFVFSNVKDKFDFI